MRKKMRKKMCRNCKFRVKVIYGAEECTRACTRISTYRRISKEYSRITFAQFRRSRERENRLNMRLRANVSTYVTGKRARRLYARTAVQKGRGKCKGKERKREATRRVSTPREEDGARNLDKTDKNGDDGTGRWGREEKEPSAADEVDGDTAERTREHAYASTK